MLIKERIRMKEKAPSTYSPPDADKKKKGGNTSKGSGKTPPRRKAHWLFLSVRGKEGKQLIEETTNLKKEKKKNRSRKGENLTGN